MLPGFTPAINPSCPPNTNAPLKENAAREAKIKKDRKIIEENAKEIDEQTRAERGVE